MSAELNAAGGRLLEASPTATFRVSSWQRAQSHSFTHSLITCWDSAYLRALNSVNEESTAYSSEYRVNRCSKSCGRLSAVVQAVLDHISSKDHASLRRASRSTCERTTQHVPYIILHLSKCSTSEQLQQWCHVTKQLHHVTSIHVCVFGSISANLLNLTMQLLAQHFKNIKELHLLGVDDDSNNNNTKAGRSDDNDPAAHVITLQPLRHLIARLKVLVIEGLTVQDIAGDLQQLAAAAVARHGEGGAWQLQSLTLAVEWGYERQPEGQGDFRARLGRCKQTPWPAFLLFWSSLLKAFPSLTQLNIQLPTWVLFEFKSAGDVYERMKADSLCHQFTKVATIAAVANLVLQLKHLKVLTLTDIPDVWGNCNGISYREPAIGTAATGARGSGLAQPAVDGLHACLSNGLLPSLSAAAAAFETMDDFGCWLLQHHPALAELSVSADSGWVMR